MAPAAPQRLNQRQVILLCITLVLAVGACAFVWMNRPSPSEPATSITGTTGVVIARADLGDAWPLTVDEGSLLCTVDREILFRTDGVTYAVNGTAKSRAKANGWREIEELSVDTPQLGAGTIKNLQPLVDRGLALCR